VNVLDPATWTPLQGLLVGALVVTVAVAAWRGARAEYRAASTRTIAYAVVLTAIAAGLGQLSIALPIGAKLSPGQHMVNVMSAVLLGPWWAVLVAFGAAVIRVSTGTGTPLAFPGGMIGALLAGLAWRATGRLWATALGEVVGTGLLAAVVSALLVAPAIMDNPPALGTLIAAFLASTALGTALGLVALAALRRAEVVEFGPTRAGSGPGASRGA